jgi:hypothetical protein
MFGWLNAELMAASIMAIFSLFSAPLMPAGKMIVFTATTAPFHSPAVMSETRVLKSHPGR